MFATMIMSEIVDPNGKIPLKEKPNVANLIQLARDKWKLGHKQQAFEIALSGMELISQGVARCFKDIDAIKKQLPNEKPSNPGP